MLHQDTITQAKSGKATQTIAFQVAGRVSGKNSPIPGSEFSTETLTTKVIHWSIAASRPCRNEVGGSWFSGYSATLPVFTFQGSAATSVALSTWSGGWDENNFSLAAVGMF
jgi:hypothetical protein